MTAALVLFVREIRRLSRQRVRLVVAILTPMLVWAVLSSGLSGGLSSGLSESANGSGIGPAAEGYAGFALPGAAALVVVFSSIFGAISLIEDRASGYLQAVLVSPAPVSAIAWSKLLGSATVACVQAVVVLLALPFVGGVPGVTAILGVLVVVWCMSVFVSGLSLALAWRLDSVAAFHGVMNLVLMPMWLLSGAVFPRSSSSGWMSMAAAWNPLGWPVGLMRSLFAGEDASALAWVGTLVIMVAGIAMALGAIRDRPRG